MEEQSKKRRRIEEKDEEERGEEEGEKEVKEETVILEAVGPAPPPPKKKKKGFSFLSFSFFFLREVKGVRKNSFLIPFFNEIPAFEGRMKNNNWFVNSRNERVTESKIKSKSNNWKNQQSFKNNKKKNK